MLFVNMKMLSYSGNRLNNINGRSLRHGSLCSLYVALTTDNDNCYAETEAGLRIVKP